MINELATDDIDDDFEGAEEETIGRTSRAVQSGTFRVVNGVVIDPNLQEGAGGQK